MRRSSRSPRSTRHPRVPGQADAPALPRAYSGRAFTWISEALTLGYLPEEFRDKLEWYPSPNQERFFDANNVVLRIASRVTPQAIQVLPFKLLIADVRWRNRTSRP